MTQSEKLRGVYNRIAKDYNQDHLGDTWDDNYLDQFARELTKGAKVLDLGCGPGTDSKKLIGYGLDVSGFDLSDELLAIARIKNPDHEFTQGDMHSLPYIDNQFDGVCAKACFLHLPKADMPGVLQEVNRVMKPGALLHVAIKGGSGEKEITEDDYGYEYTRFFSFWNAKDFSDLLIKNGFIVEMADEDRANSTLWLKYLATKR